MTAGILTAIFAGCLAFATALAVVRNAAGLGLVQAPNERSSHSRPTPSGGGVGIVAGGAVATATFALAVPWPTLPILGLSLVVAAIGFVDDRRHIPAPLRLLAQLVLVALLVGLLPFDQLIAALDLPLFDTVAAILLVVAATYWINLFNFMDGIDGMAGAQAAFIILAAAFLAVETGAPFDTPMIWWMIGLAAAIAGFLLLNWPPARIFMGDAGSTWLGFVIAALAGWTIALGWLNLYQWLILGAVFIVDATVTLARRLLRGESPLRAHRLHAYQHLSRRWGSHLPVTLLYVAVDVVLLPLAWASGLLPGVGPVATVAAYVALVAGLLWAGAGAKETAG